MTHDRIAADSAVLAGKAVSRGTRIGVDLILRKLGAGVSIVEILADHSHLTEVDIHAAQAFAVDYIANEEVIYG